MSNLKIGIFVIATLSVVAGCAGLSSNQVDSQESSEPEGPTDTGTLNDPRGTSGEIFAYRLILTPEADAAPSVGVTITNASDNDTVVYNETLRLDEEIDLSTQFDSKSEYDVVVDVGGETKTYHITSNEAYKIHINKDGVVFTEMLIN